MVIAAMMTPDQICEKLAAWAGVARIRSRIDVTELGYSGSEGSLVTSKSDLLSRMIYAGEMPSVTECPVHKGVWSGIHKGWPGTEAGMYSAPEEVADAEGQALLEDWYADGCRCFQHRGSHATTGWQPDKACGCVDPVRDAQEARDKAEILMMADRKMMEDEAAKALIGRGGVGAAMDEKALVMERRKREEGG